MIDCFPIIVPRRNAVYDLVRRVKSRLAAQLALTGDNAACLLSIRSIKLAKKRSIETKNATMQSRVGHLVPAYPLGMEAVTVNLAFQDFD